MIGYLIHTFPVYSSTFITGEIALLREQGIRPALFAVQHPRREEIPPEFRPFERETCYVFPVHAARFLVRHLCCFSARPVRYLRTLGGALTWGSLSFRNRVRTLFHFFEAVYLYPEIRRAGCDYLHVHFLSGSASIALFLKHLYGLPYSLTAHGTDIFVEKVLIPQKVAHACFTRVGTEFNRAHVLKLCGEAGVSSGPIEVIPFGISADLLELTREPQPQARPLQILNVGRLVWQKAQRILISAVSRLSGEGPDHWVRIIGEGPLRGELEKQITENDLSQKVRLEGHKGEEEVAQAYRQADLFVLSSVTEGFGLVVLEAMAAGLPVIAPRMNGIPEIITDGKNGRLFTTGDAEDLARVLEELLNDPAQRARLGSEARLRARDYLNSAQVARFLTALLAAARRTSAKLQEVPLACAADSNRA